MKSRIARTSKQNWVTISTAKTERFRGRDLFRDRAVEFVVADAGMAFRIAGNADGADAAPTEHAGVDRVQGAPERPVLAAVTGDHQYAVRRRLRR